MHARPDRSLLHQHTREAVFQHHAPESFTMSTQKSNTIVAVASLLIALVIIGYAMTAGKKATPPASDESATHSPDTTKPGTTIPATGTSAKHARAPSSNEKNRTASLTDTVAKIDQHTDLTKPQTAPALVPADIPPVTDQETSPKAVDAPTGSATPSLIDAASQGDIAALESLIASGADLNISDSSGKTALMAAAGQGHLDAVFVLLNAGADPSLRDNQRRAARDYALARFDTAGKTIARVLDGATGPGPISGPNDK